MGLSASPLYRGCACCALVGGQNRIRGRAIRAPTADDRRTPQSVERLHPCGLTEGLTRIRAVLRVDRAAGGAPLLRDRRPRGPVLRGEARPLPPARRRVLRGRALPGLL